MRSGLCAGGPWDGQKYETEKDVLFVSIPVMRKDCFLARYEWKEKLNIWLWHGPKDIMPLKSLARLIQERDL